MRQNKSCDLQICDLGLARGYVEEEEDKTEYVVTRWYRAPEVILNASEYSKAVDIWSVGCIAAELFGRTPLFPGEDFLDQVQRIVSVLGTPTSDDMKYIGTLTMTQETNRPSSTSVPCRNAHGSLGRNYSLTSLPRLLTCCPRC